MQIKSLSPDFAVSPQLAANDVAEAAAAGFRSIIVNRPDDEEPGQISADEMQALAEQHNLGFAFVPVTPGQLGEVEVAGMVEALGRLPAPVLAYCRSGTRSTSLYTLATTLYTLATTKKAGESPVEAASKDAPQAGKGASSGMTETAGSGTVRSLGRHIYDVVVVGGGSAGISLAASLLKRRPTLDIAVVEPAENHYYQPGWTMVGAGMFKAPATRRPMASVMPEGVTWIKEAACIFRPDDNELVLENGSVVSYRMLAVAPGIKLDWEAIPGLAKTLGKNGVTSNYRYDLAPYTYELATTLKSGRALFTQPPMPIKCAGAPQKAMYLCCDIWRDNGVLGDIDVTFHNAGGVLFGVPAFVPALMDYVERYGINLALGSKLVSVDGQAKTAVFEQTSPDGETQRVARSFDMLHAVPPQRAPDFVAQSPLAGESGFVAVDPETLQSTKYPNVFGLGDAAETSNAKTMAAARKQAPIVAVNMLDVLEGRAPSTCYNGYGACPLTVERGKIVLAEFGYGGKLLPSFPTWMINGQKATRAAWFLKDRILPPVYWTLMLRGREWLARPEPTSVGEKAKTA